MMQIPAENKTKHNDMKPSETKQNEKQNKAKQYSDQTSDRKK